MAEGAASVRGERSDALVDLEASEAGQPSGDAGLPRGLHGNQPADVVRGLFGDGSHGKPPGDRGISKDPLALDRRDRNPLTGAEFLVPALANPRITRFTLPLLTNTEIRAQHRTMVAAIGAAGDALWIPDTGLALSELNARCLWGAIAASGDEAIAVRDYPAASSRSFRIVERL